MLGPGRRLYLPLMFQFARTAMLALGAILLVPHTQHSATLAMLDHGPRSLGQLSAHFVHLAAGPLQSGRHLACLVFLALGPALLARHQPQFACLAELVLGLQRAMLPASHSVKIATLVLGRVLLDHHHAIIA